MGPREAFRAAKIHDVHWSNLRVHRVAPDPRDLMRPYPADLMRMWPISTRVNKPENDDPSIVEPIQLATDAA
jgi:putative SOS response-associated peptidase YedK